MTKTSLTYAWTPPTCYACGAALCESENSPPPPKIMPAYLSLINLSSTQTEDRALIVGTKNDHISMV